MHLRHYDWKTVVSEDDIAGVVDGVERAYTLYHTYCGEYLKYGEVLEPFLMHSEHWKNAQYCDACVLLRMEALSRNIVEPDNHGG